MLTKVNETALAERILARRDQQPEYGSATSFAPPQSTQLFDGNGGLLNARCTPEIIRLLVLYTPAAAQGRNISSIVIWPFKKPTRHILTARSQAGELLLITFSNLVSMRVVILVKI